MSVLSAFAVALTRDDIADYVSAVFLVYFILIFARILLSWVYAAQRGMPTNRTLRTIIDFVHQTTDPYLNLFRRFLPPVGGARFALDLSPIIAIIVLFIVQAVVVGLIRE
ncbi:MAG: YggT family protein [Solirubrobacterales bacterium]